MRWFRLDGIHRRRHLASSCNGRRIMIDDEQTPEDDLYPWCAYKSYYGLLMDPCEDWIMASVTDDNMLQIWQVAEHIYNDEDHRAAELVKCINQMCFT
ncbi:hypothetical protein Ccrd_026664 [Cynara cardunculus var. scolymus]|uniref:WD40 repeat-containing protein n=1 Tax=Cynara cardunculus var. scolymus TaxID=59895 RepID=A0A103LPJ8_CYNCS|nr:hypothetical protein Ccrd_026664 [Cynara cardunculus var. scolymus]